jgi:hypothetical protein
MNRTFKAAVAALMLAFGFAGAAAAQSGTFSERFLFSNRAPSSGHAPNPPDEAARASNNKGGQC